MTCMKCMTNAIGLNAFLFVVSMHTAQLAFTCMEIPGNLYGIETACVEMQT